ncbi:TOG array regulator of axonemal microtubules protein 1-like isoform X2 [Ictalurus furcatus]|uniref:TOG array regulator of axonemal microtubules protein 1-like isoform X2 n=1 Tax=Ictalurus furcatus TaxID=66913 RepID=UPI002350D775|nr:TOG array regulator of axonemal microtubules protein 1-like isoform X2 [Ictalurus furcatus]
MRFIKSQPMHSLLQITSSSELGLRGSFTLSSSSSSGIIYGLIPLELHEQLLDHENYQNRTNGIEELKTILSELDLKTVSFDSIEEFIYFLHRLLDDTNFKVLYGTLQVLNLLVQKLEYDVDRYYKQIAHVALKTLGDTRAVPRNEYMNVFRQLMRIVEPQKILDLVTGHLKHKNSRVREDVLNIIIAAMLAHPRKYFNIPHLCFLVAPYLVDSNKRVRQAALELFAVFDYCLDTGNKQLIMKAIDRVEFTGDAEGLMAAVQARRARHVLPRLSADGTVEYALAIPKPGQRRTTQFGPEADLDWILNRGRSNSTRSHRTDVYSEGLDIYSSLGSLTDEIPLQRSIVRAGKGKNKLPWERSRLPSAGNQEPCSALNGKLSDKSTLEDLTTSMRLNQETCVTQSGKAGFTRRSPMHASRTSVASPSSFPQALNAVRSSPPISQLFVQDAWNQLSKCSRNLHLDLTVMNLQEPDEEPVDNEESNLDSSSLTSPSLTSPMSESNLSSRYSPTTPTINGTKSRDSICIPTGFHSRHTLPWWRRAPILTRTQPSRSNSSDEIIPVTLKKDPNEQVELRPFSRPELVLTQSFRLLNSDNWEKKIKGLMFLHCLARYHSDVLHSRLHDICLALIQEKRMDQELEATAKVLLHRAGETIALIRQDVDAALNSMVQNCTPTRSMNALLAGGLGHLNAAIRKCTAQHLTTLVKKIGTGRLLSGVKDLTDRILPAVSKLAQDSSQETRYFGRQMLLFLSSHRDFDKMVEKYIPPKDLATIRNTVVTLKAKGPGEMPQYTLSARGRCSGGGMVRASSLTRGPLISSSKNNKKAQLRSIVDETEYVKQLKVLLSSKDFRERIKGIDQLVANCEENSYMVMGNIFPVFDAFKERLQESNRKVNLYALEALQKIITLLKDNLAQAVHIFIPAVLDNLNSKNNAIYTAATGAIRALINNINNTAVLLRPFCIKATFLSGKAKLDLVNRVAELVRELYPCKPQLVEHKALPLLWHLLGSSCKSGTVHGQSSTMRRATTNLCQALHAHMGPMLLNQAASQPFNIIKSLKENLQTLTPL